MRNLAFQSFANNASLRNRNQRYVLLMENFWLYSFYAAYLIIGLTYLSIVFLCHQLAIVIPLHAILGKWKHWKGFPRFFEETAVFVTTLMLDHYIMVILKS